MVFFIGFVNFFLVYLVDEQTLRVICLLLQSRVLEVAGDSSHALLH